MKAKRERNRLREYYLIEHDPEDTQQYSVWDLSVIFSNNHTSFRCSTLKEAEDLVRLLTILRNREKK